MNERKGSSIFTNYFSFIGPLKLFNRETLHRGKLVLLLLLIRNFQLNILRYTLPSNTHILRCFDNTNVQCLMKFIRHIFHCLFMCW